jgi:cation transport regulator ChaC
MSPPPRYKSSLSRTVRLEVAVIHLVAIDRDAVSASKAVWGESQHRRRSTRHHPQLSDRISSSQTEPGAAADIQSGGKWVIMSLTIPASTKKVLEVIEAKRQPTVEYQIAGKLSGLHQAEGLTDQERKGAWAEASAFNFSGAHGESPWDTHFRPTFVATKNDGSPFYAPDIAEIDDQIVGHWEERSATAQHPVLRARYADIAWDFKKRVTGKSAEVLYAQRAIDAYIEGITAKLYEAPLIHAVQAGRRALELALSINDKARVELCKKTLLDLFDTGLQPGSAGVWTSVFDTLIQTKKAGLLPAEIEHLIQGLERVLSASGTLGVDGFDPWAAEAAAQRLASYYESQGKRGEAQRAIRTYGSAFEQLAAQASPMMAMAWLQPVHDEYKNRGMNEDVARVQTASAEKGKNVSSDLKQMRVPIELSEEEIERVVTELAQGTPEDALLRIARELIPKTGKIKALLQEIAKTAPLMARIGVTRIVGDHFAAHAGSIEEDPEGRLIMELANHIEMYNFVLGRTLDSLRNNSVVTADTIMGVLEESPVYTPERRGVLKEGVQAYLEGDHTKAIHVLIPQIEQALRQLLVFIGVPTLKAGRSGLMQVKNLNDILRDQAIRAALGEDLRLYLQTFLADERGQNIRNNVCHGLSLPTQFNQRLADQVLHALLAVSLVRKKLSPREGMMLLFQYGSNCDEQRLNSPERLDGAAKNPLLAETVDEYDLAFDVWSRTNACAASNLVTAPETGRRALGVLYEVPADLIRGRRSDGKKTMTDIEGPSYEERKIKVRAANGSLAEAVTFVVRKAARQDGLWTSSSYVGHIVKGLRERQAPEAYIQRVIEAALTANRQAENAPENETRKITELADVDANHSSS